MTYYIPDLEHFMAACNGTGRRRRRCRLATAADYARLCDYHVVVAAAAAAAGQPYYYGDNAGSVCRAYVARNLYTAVWGCWVDPATGWVVVEFRRALCNGAGVAPCAYYGGHRQYMADWRTVHPQWD